MNPIRVLAGLEQGERYEAIQQLERLVLAHSEYGDPDSSLQDWLAAGDYKGTETPEQIAAEWDDRR